MQAARGTPLTNPRALLAAVAAAVLAADVATKVWAVASLADRQVRLLGGWLVLHEQRNPGAAFSIAGGATLVFTLVAAAVVVVIVRTARGLRSRAWGAALGCLLGGALGNLTDRLLRDPAPLRGHVVDFIDIQRNGASLWPVFNVADMAIVAGAGLALLLSFRGVELGEPADEPGDTEA